MPANRIGPAGDAEDSPLKRSAGDLGNLGASSLRRRHRKGDPMQAYDALPPALRGWLSRAALPWSPASARRIWVRAHADGLSDADALAILSRAERRTLERDRHSLIQD